MQDNFELSEELLPLEIYYEIVEHSSNFDLLNFALTSHTHLTLLQPMLDARKFLHHLGQFFVSPHPHGPHRAIEKLAKLLNNYDQTITKNIFRTLYLIEERNEFDNARLLSLIKLISFRFNLSSTDYFYFTLNVNAPKLRDHLYNGKRCIEGKSRWYEHCPFEEMKRDWKSMASLQAKR